MTFNSEAEARAYAQQNPNTQIGYSAPNQRESIDNQRLNYLYELAKANPYNSNVADLYTSSLSDYYNPYGSQYQAMQADRKQRLAEAELLGNVENNTAADTQFTNILSQLYPEMRQSPTQNTFNADELLRQSFANKYNALTTGENYNPVSNVKDATYYNAMANATPSMSQRYSSDVTPQEVYGAATGRGWGDLLGLAGAPGLALSTILKANDQEAIRRKRLGY